MAARATSSGTISFGLVSIPVKVYASTRSKAIRFNMLDPKDRSRVKQQLVNATSGEPVERSETLKGYEYARDQYVVFTDEEVKALEHKSDKTIEIEEFIPIEKVDPRYFDKAQLLGPDKGGSKPYRLLNEAMTLMGRVAVGRWNTRGKQQLVLIRPVQQGLMLHALHYADEMRAFDDIEFGDPVELKAGEVELANQLIEQLSNPDFEPEKYEDGFRRVVLEAVDRKVAGEEVVFAKPAETQEQIIDLVAALKKSLEEKSGAKLAKPGPKKVTRSRKKAAGEKSEAGRRRAGS